MLLLWTKPGQLCIVPPQRQTGGLAVGSQTQHPGVVHPQQHYPSLPLYPQDVPLQEVPNGHDLCHTGKPWFCYGNNVLGRILDYVVYRRLTVNMLYCTTTVSFTQHSWKVVTGCPTSVEPNKTYVCQNIWMGAYPVTWWAFQVCACLYRMCMQHNMFAVYLRIICLRMSLE